MRIISKITLFLIFLPSCLARGQGIYVPSKTVNSQVNGILRPVAGATITVCAAGNSNIPCAPPLAGVLFKDQALTQPLANPTTTDLNGNYPTMALAAGNYTITETAVGFTGFSYQITIPLTGVNLVVGNCVQAAAGGALTTTASSCGTSAGTLTATGSPSSGNLAKFSGATSLTNADLTGDVTTSGTTTTTLANTLIACGANQFTTQSGRTPGCTQPSFSNLSGTIVSAQFGSQTSSTFLAAPTGSSGNPTFRTVVAADLPTLPSFQINGGTSSGIFSVSGGSPSTFGNAVNYTTSGTSGGIPYFSSSTTVSSSTALSAHAVVVGAGASAAPLTIAADTATTHALMATAGDPAFRALVGSDIPTINLAASGNGGVTGTLPTGNLPTGIPVANLANGTSGQCINTSGSTVVWGSCAGTAGVQVPGSGINTTTVSVSAAVTSLQTMQSFSFGSGALNSVGKSFRVFVSGTMNPVNTTEVINLGIHLTTGAGSSDDTIGFTPSSTSFQNWRIEYRCSTVTTGATGSILCAINAFDIVGSNGTIQLFGLGNTVTHSSSDLTGTVSVASEVSFSTASSSNLASSVYMVVEQMN